MLCIQGRQLKIEFRANQVSYSEAIDGEIVQVEFAEKEDAVEDGTELNAEIFDPTDRYLHISAAYEFGSRIPDAEWSDGKEASGGVNVDSFKISATEATINLKNRYTFHIEHSANESVIKKIRSFLLRDCREINA